MQKNSVFYRVFLTVRSSLKYVAFLNVKNPVFYIKKSIFSKSKSPTANRYWGWNNLTKVVQSTNKVWRLHSSVLKKSTFSIKKWIWLELLLFFAFQRYDCFWPTSQLWWIPDGCTRNPCSNHYWGFVSTYLKFLPPKYHGLKLHIGFGA